MKQHGLLYLSLLGALGLMTGCTGQMTQGEQMDSTKQAKECLNLDKQLFKVDNLIVKVNEYPASQIDELAYTLPQPEITQSTNKKRILSDAQKKRSMLLNEQQKMGCKTPTKK
jgi:hypothetical protein